MTEQFGPISAPAGDLERENTKLRKINRVLMDRVERSMDHQGSAFSLFQTAIMLEDKVTERTLALANALHDLEAANDAAETARQFLYEAIESISEGFLLCDAHDRIVLTNGKFGEMWPGVGHCLDAGQPFDALIRRVAASGLVADTIHDPDLWAAYRLERHANPGEPFVVPMADGSWMQISERRTRDGGIVSIYTDITAIKLSEERRREQELAEKSILLQTTLDNLAQGVSVSDASARLVAWNHRFIELLALSEGDIRAGIPLHQLLAAEGLNLHFPPNRTAESLLTEYQSATGRILEVRRNPMPGGGFVTTYTDITEQRLAAEQLREAKESLEQRVEARTRELQAANRGLSAAKSEAEQANLSKTRFLAAASHDLLQPLNAARVFASSLTERRLAPANARLVQSTLKALDSVDGILTALLDISKLDAGVQPVDLRDFRLSDLFTMLSEEYALLASRKGITLHLVPSSLAVRSDARLLGRILRNYLSNAIRYTPPGGRILIGCLRRGAAVLIGVWDSGSGIPADKIDEIFEEFRRLHTDGDTSEKGMGLGLAIVRRIARMLDHPLVVRSQLGRGSAFAVQVPRAATLPPAATRPAPVPAAAVSSLKGARIVVIDNEPEILAGMEVLLAHWGCDIVCARSRAGAMAAQEQPPDLIIADYHLDHGELGLAVIAALRERFGELPAIILTADHSDQLRTQVEKSGCHLLTKPARKGKLRSLMAHLLHGRAAPPA